MDNRLEIECENLTKNLMVLYRKGFSLIAEPDINGINVAARGEHYTSGGLVKESDVETLYFIRAINAAIEHVNKGESNV